jgi:hypothetical protein
MRRYSEVSAASGVDADIDNYRTTLHVFNHGFSNNNWAAFYTSHRSNDITTS